jgi:hypothetical protein
MKILKISSFFYFYNLSFYVQKLFKNNYTNKKQGRFPERSKGVRLKIACVMLHEFESSTYQVMFFIIFDKKHKFKYLLIILLFILLIILLFILLFILLIILLFILLFILKNKINKLMAGHH